VLRLAPCAGGLGPLSNTTVGEEPRRRTDTRLHTEDKLGSSNLPTESPLLKLSTLRYRRFRFLHSTASRIRLHRSRGDGPTLQEELRTSGNCLERREPFGAKRP
jgi:hypothetical protein